MTARIKGSRSIGRYDEEFIKEIRRLYNEENWKYTRIAKHFDMCLYICKSICLNTHKKYYDENYIPHEPHRISITKEMLKKIRYEYNVLQKSINKVREENNIKSRYELLTRILKNEEPSYYDENYIINPRNKKRVEEYKKIYEERNREIIEKNEEPPAEEAKENQISPKTIKSIRRKFKIERRDLNYISDKFGFSYELIQDICMNRIYYDPEYFPRKSIKEDERREKATPAILLKVKTTIKNIEKNQDRRRIETEYDLFEYCKLIYNLEPFVHGRIAQEIVEESKEYKQYKDDIRKVIHVLKTNNKYSYILNTNKYIRVCSTKEQVNKVLDILDRKAEDVSREILRKVREIDRTKEQTIGEKNL